MATIDYKQKIKDYMNSSEVDTLYKSMLNNLFPELAESEDEKIKNILVDFFKNYYKNTSMYFEGVEVRDIITWLEKQKISEEALQYLKENHSPSEVSDFQAAMNIAVAKAYDKGYNDALKKQGKQKPFDYEKAHIQQNDFTPKSAMEAIKGEKLDNQTCVKPAEEYNITGISSNKSQGKLGEIIKNLKTTWSEDYDTIIKEE